MLEKIPSGSTHAALVINSHAGSYSQAELISQKIREAALKKKIKFYTFTEVIATNAGLYLLTQAGEKVFSSETAILGGVEVGDIKINSSALQKYFYEVRYTSDDEPAYHSEIESLDSMN